MTSNKFPPFSSAEKLTLIEIHNLIASIALTKSQEDFRLSELKTLDEMLFLKGRLRINTYQLYAMHMSNELANFYSEVGILDKDDCFAFGSSTEFVGHLEQVVELPTYDFYWHLELFADVVGSAIPDLYKESDFVVPQQYKRLFEALCKLGFVLRSNGRYKWSPEMELVFHAVQRRWKAWEPFELLVAKIFAGMPSEYQKQIENFKLQGTDLVLLITRHWAWGDWKTESFLSRKYIKRPAAFGVAEELASRKYVKIFTT
jgi:hypothetical protein